MNTVVSHFLVAYFTASLCISIAAFKPKASDKFDNTMSFILMLLFSPIIAMFGVLSWMLVEISDFFQLKFWVNKYLIGYKIKGLDATYDIGTLKSICAFVESKNSIKGFRGLIFRKTAKKVFQLNPQNVSIMWWWHSSTDKEAAKNKVFPNKHAYDLTDEEVLKIYQEDIKTNKYVWHKW